MTEYLTNGHSESHPAALPMRPTAIEQSAELTSEQIENWRASINESQHPVIVFNASSRPILLNDALRALLSEPDVAEGTNQPTAFVWQEICEAVARIVTEYASATSATSIAEAFPVHQRCFVAVGSVLRSPSGQLLGAVINLGDLNGSKDRLQSFFSHQSAVATDDAPAVVSDESQAAFQEWKIRREEARKRMAKLSRRESQVVALVSDGLPNKSVAHELDISVKTIEKHRANATRKLGVGSTAEMVRIAVVADNKPPESRPAAASGNPDRPFPDSFPGRANSFS